MKDKDNNNQTRKPEWAPENDNVKFASRVIGGIKQTNKTNNSQTHNVNNKIITHDIDKLYQGILASDRTILSKAITLIESNSAKHFSYAQELLRRLIPHSGKSVRIGITGVPGAGKSTFIEAFGIWLIEQGYQVAVLAIDPSSTISKGSILGDKTRMEKLSRLEESFIRPSPSSGVLGGVARKTRETIVVCEAAGYDVILIETVGVGQSEVTVRSIVDFFLLLQITGAGDELQGIKKGIIELADLIAINKADGENANKAEITKNEINQILYYLQPATPGWKTHAVTCSALNGLNLPVIWNIIADFLKVTKESGYFVKRRSSQNLEWFKSMMHEAMDNFFFSNTELVNKYLQYKEEILTGQITATLAVSQLMELFKKSYKFTPLDG